MERKFSVGKTIYQRCKKFGVGKEIGGKIYVHKNYCIKIIDPDIFLMAVNALPYGFIFNCVMIDLREERIRFDEAPDFDMAREPHPGHYIEIDLKTMEIRYGYSDYIWHHKWMWVEDDYKGFNVEDSYEWSLTWTKLITHPSGSRRVWLKQISALK